MCTKMLIPLTKHVLFFRIVRQHRSGTHLTVFIVLCVVLSMWSVVSFINVYSIKEHDYLVLDNNKEENCDKGIYNPKLCKSECWKGSPWKIPSVIVQPNCPKSNDLEVLIYIYSKTFNFGNRKATRKAYKYHFEHQANVGLVFIIAKQDAAKIMDDFLHREIEENRDILQLDYIEDYKQLAYKGMGIFEWTKKCGKNLKILIKGDDDSRGLFGMVRVLLEQSKALDVTFNDHVYCLSSYKDIIVHEKKHKSRWEVSKSEYPGQYFPMYCSGNGATIIPKRVALQLLEASKSTKIFKIDDVYISGLLRHRACVGIKDLKTWTFRIKYFCYYKYGILI